LLKSTYSPEKSADPKKDDSEVVAKLTELAEDLPTRGFDVYYNRIRTEGLVWNHKRVLRVYRGMKLGMRRRHKKRVPSRIKQPLETPGSLNEVWSMDFMSDALSDGRRVRMFNVIDDYNREALAVEPGLSFPATRVTRVLNQLEEEIGLPKVIRVDNGPEFISKEFTAWCKQKDIEIRYIQPGKPMQNGFIERFNRTFREDVLDAYWFEDLEQLGIIAEKWRYDYNFYHPHKALEYKAPCQYASRYSKDLYPWKEEENENIVKFIPV
jgi:putative transposase